MGNEISHEKATTDNVAGRGHVGHFHKVLVEPDYADLDLPCSSQATQDVSRSGEAAARVEPEYATPDLPCDSRAKTDLQHSTQDGLEKGSASNNTEYSRTSNTRPTETHSIIEECKALITESANKALARNLSDSHIYKNPDTKNKAIGDTVRTRTQSENFKQGETSKLNTENSGSIIKLGRKKKCSNQPDSKPTGIRKHGKGRTTIINMFKFSKRKPKIVAEFVPQTGGIQELDTSENSSQETMNNVHKQNGNGEDAKIHEHNIQECSIKNGQYLQHASEATTEKFIQGNENLLDQRNEDSDHHTKSIDVERLDSSDSGIVVEKTESSQTIVAEYAIVQKKANKSTQLERDDNYKDMSKHTSNASDVLQNVSSEITANVSSSNDDYTHINERAVDVEGLTIKTRRDPPQYINNESEISNNTSNVNPIINENTNRIGTDGEISVVDTVPKPDKKIKKKSWSFQIGGNRKKSNEFSPSGSVDSDYVNVERKKHKSSLWGKLSFRKSSDDVSSDTKHGSFDAIPETVKSESKTKLKLRNIKAKKEKKAKKRDKIEEASEDSSLGSHPCFASTSDINTPGSRRSIVDDDFSYTQSDAFEGVSLSDLSLEGDEHVSNNPAGTKEQVQQKMSRSEEIKQENQNRAENAKARVDYVNTEVHIHQTQNEDRRTDIDGNKDITGNSDTKHNIQTMESKDYNVDSVIKEETSHVVDVNQHPSTPLANNPVTVIPARTLDGYAIVVKNVKQNNTEVNKTCDAIDKELEPNSDLNSSVPKHVEPTVIIDQATEQNLTSRRIGEKLASSHDMAYSNLIYGDYALTTQKHDDVSDDESDAYVQLEQLVEDYKHCEVDSSRDNTDTISAEQIHNTTADDTSPNLPTRIKASVIVMKEVGVQAPDIYMPLDIDVDFGTSHSNCGYVSRGTQVSDTEFVLDIAQKSPSANLQPAYF